VKATAGRLAFALCLLWAAPPPAARCAGGRSSKKAPAREAADAKARETLESLRDSIARQMGDLSPLLQKLEAMKASYAEDGGPAEADARGRLLTDIYARDRSLHDDIHRLRDLRRAREGLELLGLADKMRNKNPLPALGKDLALHFSGREFEEEARAFGRRIESALQGDAAAYSAAQEARAARRRWLRLGEAVGACLALVLGFLGWRFLPRRPALLSCFLCLLFAPGLAREPDAPSAAAPRSPQEVIQRIERLQERMALNMEELTKLLQRLQVMKNSYFSLDDPRTLSAERQRLSADVRSRLDDLGSSRKELVAFCQMYEGLIFAQAGSNLGIRRRGGALRSTKTASPSHFVDAASGFLAWGNCRLFEARVSALHSKGEAAFRSEQEAFQAAARSFEERRRRRMLLLGGALALAAAAAAWLLAR